MKHNYLKHLFTALLLLCATIATAHDFEVGGIYYNILSKEDKTVEVTYKGTSYSQYSNEYTGSVVIPSTVVKSSGITFDAWTSTNKSDGSTSQTTYTLKVEAGSVFKFYWSVSSENNYDWLTITLDGKEIVRYSGILSGTYETIFNTAGTHTLVVKYTKDVSVNKGDDEAKIYNIILSDASGNVNDVVYRVTSIGYDAFLNCSGLTSIEIPNSVTSIGYQAFNGCTGLTSVVIGNSVTKIEDYAFRYCTGLTSIVVDGNNTKYDSRENCNAIIETETNTLIAGCKNTIIPNSVTSIGSGAFDGCSGLTSIEIPNSVTSIGGRAFDGCTGLTSIVIPNSVTSIGREAFSDCTSLTSVEFNAENCASMGEDYGFVFAYCKALSTVTIGENVKRIPDYAFSNCSGLSSIEIPNSVKSIGECAFKNCSGLTSIDIGNSIVGIGWDAFYGCSRLREVHINDIAAWCKIYFNSSYYSNPLSYAKNLYLDGDLVTELVIPEGVKTIDDYAFYNCSGLTSIEIPNSVTSIGSLAFNGCTGLTSVTSHIPADALFAVNTNVFNGVDKNSCTLYVPYGDKETYAAKSGWNEFVNIIELEPTEVTVNINQYGCATYCSPFALDFSNVDGLKAYAATGYKSNSQVVTLTRVQTAEAGVGLFLKGEPGEYVVPVIESTDEHSLNLLVGTLEQTTVNSTDGAMSNYKFTILPGDETPMFYPFEDNTTLSAGKAYLQIPTAWLPATAQKSLSIRFDDGTTTDVDELKGESGEVKTVYDLQGRIVENPTSGIYIIDGKKVLVK